MDATGQGAARGLAVANDARRRTPPASTTYRSVARRTTTGRPTRTSGIEAILAGDRETFELEYPRHSPDEECWFLLRTAAFEVTLPRA